MMYKSLLLQAGGGIPDEYDRRKCSSGSAALVIGIGGNGVDTLSVLKKKMLRYLEPENPGELFPRYDSVQLLAIDSDDHSLLESSGLHRNETFFLNSHGMAVPAVEFDPTLDWLDAERLHHLHIVCGAGGIRQLGRYLLFSRTSHLVGELTGKIQSALTARNTHALDVYMFAGLGGGTGSGCFIDLCYLIQQIAGNYNIDLKIFGFFFLPDVVMSKCPGMIPASNTAWMNANSFAALKELDFLMDLPSRGEWFSQRYNGSVRVHTQKSPVDLCYLISADSAVNDPYEAANQMVADYVLDHLAHCDFDPNLGGSMREHLAEENLAVPQFVRHGNFHVLGGAAAESPSRLINTYLATELMMRLKQTLNDASRNITEADVDDLIKNLHLTPSDLFNELRSHTYEMHLPMVHPVVMAENHPSEYLKTWMSEINTYLSEFEHKTELCARVLLQPLNSYNPMKANNQNLIGRLLCCLVDLCMNPDYGPRYVTALISGREANLLQRLERVGKEVWMHREGRLGELEFQRDVIDRCNEILRGRFPFSRKRMWERLYAELDRMYQVNCSIILLQKVEEVLYHFRNMVQDLNHSFFLPMCRMLDNLFETFTVNEKDFRHGVPVQANTVPADMAEPHDALHDLTVQNVLARFVTSLCENPDLLLRDDETEIQRIITQLTCEQFPDIVNRSLEEYLLIAYGNHELELPHHVFHDLLTLKLDTRAKPMFEFNDVPFADNTGRKQLFVPYEFPLVVQGAYTFCDANPSCRLWQVNGGNRLSLWTTRGGIPASAYRWYPALMASYERIGNTPEGNLLHLYCNTGRGGSRDWRTILPNPG